MKSKFIGFLSTMQCLMLLAKLGCFYAHQPLSWAIVLWPLETLLTVALLFWVLVGAIIKKVS